MVTSENKDREPQLPLYYEYYPKHSNVRVHRPQPTVWYRTESLPICSSIPDADQRESLYTHPSAFHNVSTGGYTNNRRRLHKMGLNYNTEAEENTQVTWCSTGANYRCSVVVTGGERVGDVYLPNSLRTCLDDISRCGGQDNENQGETHVVHYKTDVSSHSASSPEYSFRRDEGSASLSPVDSSTRHTTSECVLKAVISAPIKTTSHEMWDAPSTEIVAKYRNVFEKNSEQCRSGPVCISNIGLPKSHSPPNRVTEGYNKSSSLFEDETLSKNTGIPPTAGLGNEMKCWLQPTIIPSPSNEKHLSGKQVIGSRLVKDYIFFKTDGSLVKRDSCNVTEYGLRSHTSSPNSSNEENTSNSCTTASSFNDKSSYRKEPEQNMYNYNPKKNILRKANSLPIVKTQDSVVQYRTVNKPHDIKFSSIGDDKPQTVRLGTKEHVTRTNDIERKSPTGTVPSIEFHDSRTSVLALTTQSKFISGQNTHHETFVTKCPETEGKHSFCETSSSPTLNSAITYNTQNRINSPFHKTLGSDQQSTSGEHKADSNEDRGESPHTSFHLESDIKEDEQRMVVRRVMSHKFVHIENDDEIIFEKRIDYPRHSLSVVNRIKIRDYQRLDQGDLPQNISPVGFSNRMGDKQCSEDHNRYPRRSSSVETIVETGDTDLVENIPTCIKKNSLGNPKQIIVEQRPPKQDSTHQHSSPLNHSPQTDPQHLCNNQDIPFRRSTVLVPSGDLRHSGGETATREMDRIRETKLGTELQGPSLFSSEDTALRSRVLVLLWVLLGENRLREVGFPKEPVHRILWRAVDVCCSVAGVKSAAAVPLNSDHDCGVDMLCFRDHTHRFLEVCAPTREHWKQFGWAGLTVDAVVRKIYDEGKFLSSSIKSMSGKNFLLSLSITRQSRRASTTEAI